MTNADRMKGMQEDELVNAILKISRMCWGMGDFDLSDKWCDLKGACVGANGEDLECSEEKMLACIRRWLRSEAEDG